MLHASAKIVPERSIPGKIAYYTHETLIPQNRQWKYLFGGYSSSQTDFTHIETILNWHVNLRKKYAKPLRFDKILSADIGWLNLNSSFRKRTLTSWGEKCSKIPQVQIVHYEMSNSFSRANLLYRLPQSFFLRGRGSNIGFWPSSEQNSLSERP